MFDDIIDCKVIKDNNRRQVLFLQTPDGGFYLKRSILIREKDRLRHLLLPRRRWAEWRNLHRLHNAQIAAARPVMKGENKGVQPKIFFLLTEKVDGTLLKFDSFIDARKLGQYIALLHSRGVYHADLHPGNIILKPNNQPCLIDVQEVFLLPWLPSWLRIYNLGKLFFHLSSHSDSGKWREELLSGYNKGRRELVTTSKLVKALDRHKQRYYRSRGKRCFKNSTGFVIVKSNELRGYKRRNFIWGAQELRQALEKGKVLKPGRSITFNGVWIKIHHRKFIFPDLCFASWKKSRALEVRDISTTISGIFQNGW
jgi:tRNA A-37 threonylcarbamoyl transferase component Bud32